jgi:hypothetical protein
LEYYHKNKELKKTPKLITIKFNTFKCIINREKKIFKYILIFLL